MLWHCKLGLLTRKNPSPIWPIMCLVWRYALLSQSVTICQQNTSHAGVITQVNFVSRCTVLRLFSKAAQDPFRGRRHSWSGRGGKRHAAEVQSTRRKLDCTADKDATDGWSAGSCSGWYWSWQGSSHRRRQLSSYLRYLCTGTRRVCNFCFVGAIFWQDVAVREIRGR